MVNETSNFLITLTENKGAMTAITIVATVLMFGVLIFIHEFGHYITARLFKVTVHEFAIGMGPKVWSKISKKSGIRYSLRLLPIGGYVAMEGEDEESADPNAFSHKKVWQRMIITAAGGAMNLLLGLLLTFSYIITMPGLYGTTVTGFADWAVSNQGDTPLEIGDQIISIEGNRVYTGQEIIYELFRYGSEPVEIIVLRDGEKVKLEAVNFKTNTEQGHSYGYRDFSYDEQGKTPLNVLKNTACQMKLSVRMVYDSLFDLITGKYGIDEVSGPIGTAGVVGDAIKQDANAVEGQSSNSFIYICMLISVNLGLFNLLPVPALDGGRLFFQFVELIIRRPIPQKFEGMVHFVGIVLLLLLMAVVTFKDIWALFG